jgi:hypothetical protein
MSMEVMTGGLTDQPTFKKKCLDGFDHTILEMVAAFLYAQGIIRVDFVVSSSSSATKDNLRCGGYLNCLGCRNNVDQSHRQRTTVDKLHCVAAADRIIVIDCTHSWIRSKE